MNAIIKCENTFLGLVYFNVFHWNIIIFFVIIIIIIIDTIDIHVDILDDKVFRKTLL